MTQQDQNQDQNQKDAVSAMQAQTLDAIRASQAQTLQAVKQWSDNVAKFAPDMPAAPDVSADLKANFGTPREIIDSVYDFAGQLLELNKGFVHQLLDASNPQK